MQNNNVELIGKAITGLEFNHSFGNEDFYSLLLEIERISGNKDIIKVVVSDWFIADEDIENHYIGISGSVRTRNVNGHVEVFVFAETLDVLDLEGDVIGEDIVTLNGSICKKSPIRDTPMNKTICDLVVACNRPYGRSDYIPVITWGRTAKYADTLPVGTKIKIDGRLQSRTYVKDDVEHTVYELSAQSLKINE